MLISAFTNALLKSQVVFVNIKSCGVVIDDQLSFTDHIATKPGPADLPYTILGRLGPSCQSKPHKSLSKLLFSPIWTIVMLSWRAFPHVLSSLCNWSRMQQPE